MSDDGGWDWVDEPVVGEVTAVRVWRVARIIRPIPELDVKNPDPSLTIGTETGLRLQSYGVQKIWPTDGPMAAACPIDTVRSVLRKIRRSAEAIGLPESVISEIDELTGPHRPPHPGCMCGIWGLSSVAELLARVGRFVAPHLIVGTVRMWGSVIVGRAGFRSQYARPASLLAYSPWPESSWPESAPPVRPSGILPTAGDIARLSLSYDIDLIDRLPGPEELTDPAEFLSKGA